MNHPDSRAAASGFSYSRVFFEELVDAAIAHARKLGATDAVLSYELSGMAALSAIGVVAALRLWPAHDPDVIPHDHADLPADDPHHAEHAKGDHAFVIDRRHPKWPNR